MIRTLTKDNGTYMTSAELRDMAYAFSQLRSDLAKAGLHAAATAALATANWYDSHAGVLGARVAEGAAQ